MELAAKKISASAIEDHTRPIFPNDLNSQGTVFGGMIMSVLDRLCLVVAERHAERVCVTASVDAMHFLAPAGQGDILTFQVSINRSWNSSMEIGAKVMAEHFAKPGRYHILSAYFTFVAVDEQGKPVRVPEVVPETDIQKARFQEAQIRRDSRYKQAQDIKDFRA